MAIANSAIGVELREVFLRDRPQSLYSISPKGTIPVLELSDGIVIDESIDIMKWALVKSSSNWIVENSNNHNEMIHHNDTEFKMYLDKYKYYDRHPENSFEYYRDQCAKTLYRYEISLAKSIYLLGDNIELVDVAIFPFVRQCANVDRVWFASTFPNVERWLENWIQSKLFERVMFKFEAWELGDNPLYILF